MLPCFHLWQDIIYSVEHAISEDITHNANFAFSEYMGHKATGDAFYEKNGDPSFSGWLYLQHNVRNTRDHHFYFHMLSLKSPRFFRLLRPSKMCTAMPTFGPGCGWVIFQWSFNLCLGEDGRAGNCVDLKTWNILKHIFLAAGCVELLIFTSESIWLARYRHGPILRGVLRMCRVSLISMLWEMLGLSYFIVMLSYCIILWHPGWWFGFHQHMGFDLAVWPEEPNQTWYINGYDNSDPVPKAAEYLHFNRIVGGLAEKMVLSTKRFSKRVGCLSWNEVC